MTTESLKKRWWETEKSFARRCDQEKALKLIGGKKLWRVTAIEMKKNESGYRMGAIDHFSVSAYCKEMAIGTFAMERGMNWFVTGIEEETIIGGSGGNETTVEIELPSLCG